MTGVREYSWTPGRGRVVAAATVGAVVEAIQEESGGSCPPIALVDAARPKDSELHSLFEWDDSSAAESYRIDQARGVIRSLRVTVVSAGVPEFEPKPAFVSVVLPAPTATPKDGPPARGYVPIAKVMSDDELRAQALADCIKQLRGMERRYAWLTELNGLWEALNEIEKGLDGA